MSILFNVIRELTKGRRGRLSGDSKKIPPLNEIRYGEGGSIICFVGESEGDALANLTFEYVQPLAHRASRVCIVNITKLNWQDELFQILHDPVWFIYSFFGIGQDFHVETADGPKNLWEVCGIPFVRIFGDIPAYFPDRHIGKYRNLINIYGNKSHSDFYQRWFDHPAVTLVMPVFALEERPLKEVNVEVKKNSPIIFLKNGNSPDALIDFWRKSLPDSIKNCLESISEECVARSVINGELNIDDRVIQHYKRQGIDVVHERAIMCFLVAQVDDYVRRIKSSMITEAIIDLPVVIRGTAWGHINFNGKKALLDQSSDFASSRALFDAAPAIIDMSPNTTDAPHDRVLRAAGRGTAFLTNYQNFLGKITNKPAECAFDFNKDSIHDLVEHYVSNPEAAVQLGLQQASAFRQFFTREKYADALLSIIQMKGLYMGGRPDGTQNFVDFPPRNFP